MITTLYLTYIIFAGVALVSTAVLLFKLNFTLAVLIVGFSVLAYFTKVLGIYFLAQKQQEIVAEFQKNGLKSQNPHIVEYLNKNPEVVEKLKSFQANGNNLNN